MIVGIGVDIVAVKRFERWYTNSSLVKRYFHETEWSVLEKTKTSAVQSLAVRFAAKEAFSKALGCGFRGLSLNNICVKNDDLGKPELLLYGDALDVFKKSGADVIHVSLSHEKEYGIAFVTLEKNDK